MGGGDDALCLTNEWGANPSQSNYTLHPQRSHRVTLEQFLLGDNLGALVWASGLDPWQDDAKCTVLAIASCVILIEA